MSVVFTASQPSLNDAVATLSKAVRPASTLGTGAVTLTTAQMINGVATIPDGGAAANITTPTAAAIVAAIRGAAVGTSFMFLMRNNDAADAKTLVGGTGVTIVGTAAVAATTTALCVVHLTNVTASSEAVTVYVK